jgi:hypothetical protein
MSLLIVRIVVTFLIHIYIYICVCVPVHHGVGMPKINKSFGKWGDTERPWENHGVPWTSMRSLRLSKSCKGLRERLCESG